MVVDGLVLLEGAVVGDELVVDVLSDLVGRVAAGVDERARGEAFARDDAELGGFCEFEKVQGGAVVQLDSQVFQQSAGALDV